VAHKKNEQALHTLYVIDQENSFGNNWPRSL